MRYFMPVLALLSSAAYAHVPYVEGLDFTDDAGFTIEQPIEKSLAIYLSFDSATDIDSAVFTLKASDLQPGSRYLVKDSEGHVGRRVSFDTIVPACAAYADVLPSVALTGPAQVSLATNLTDASLPFALQEGEGIFLLENSRQGAIFKEPVSGTSYWQQRKGDLIVTKPGTYTIRIWEPQGHSGDYVLVFGRKEIFGIKEIIQSGKRIGYLRKGQEIKDASCRQELKP